jgi:CHASE2 domain-containing sensor protein
VSQPVLALGAALLTASGSVWYVPALADLRAGADRPHFRRTAATACLSGWSTAGIVAALLMMSEAWWIPCAAAVAGTAVTVGLRTRAAAQRRREVREAARHWAQLGRWRPLAGSDRSRSAFALLVGSGLATAVATATLLLTVGAEHGPDWLTAAAPAALVGLFLAIAVTYTRMVRRRTAR